MYNWEHSPTLRVDIVNPGQSAVSLQHTRWPDRMELSNAMTIMRRNHRTTNVIFHGLKARRKAAPTGTMISIAANATASMLYHDLDELYDFREPGSYFVEFIMLIDATTAIAGTTTFNMPMHLSPRRNTHMSAFANTSSCTTNETNRISAAVADAIAKATYAATCTTDTCAVQQHVWFGDSFQHIEQSRMRHKLVRIANALPACNFYCGHSFCDSSIYAFVFASDPGCNIYLCPLVWQSTHLELIITIIHEASHFVHTANTRDFVYGERACWRLAHSSNAVALAQLTADCVAFYTAYSTRCMSSLANTTTAVHWWPCKSCTDHLCASPNDGNCDAGGECATGTDSADCYIMTNECPGMHLYNLSAVRQFVVASPTENNETAPLRVYRIVWNALLLFLMWLLLWPPRLHQ